MATIPSALGFQIDQARKAGYDDAEIVRHLAEKPELGGKIKLAQNSGYPDQEILGHLSKPTTLPGAAPPPDIMNMPRSASGTPIPNAPVTQADLDTRAQAARFAQQYPISHAVLNMFKESLPGPEAMSMRGVNGTTLDPAIAAIGGAAKGALKGLWSGVQELPIVGKTVKALKEPVTGAYQGGKEAFRKAAMVNAQAENVRPAPAWQGIEPPPDMQPQPSAFSAPVALPSGRVPGPVAPPVPGARPPLWQGIVSAEPNIPAQFGGVPGQLPSGRVPGPIAPPASISRTAPLWQGIAPGPTVAPEFSGTAGTLPSGRVPGKPGAIPASMTPPPGNPLQELLNSGQKLTPEAVQDAAERLRTAKGLTHAEGSIVAGPEYQGHANPTAALALDRKVADYALQKGFAPASRADLTLDKVNAWRRAINPSGKDIKPGDAAKRLDQLWERFKEKPSATPRYDPRTGGLTRPPQ